jgi:hypothetical protein
VDFDDDGKLDLVAGDSDGSVWFFRNTGGKLAAGVMVEADGKPICGSKTVMKGDVRKTEPASSKLADDYSKLDIADWDGDGLKDLIIGHSRSELVLYMNTGKKGEPRFGPPRKIEPEKDPLPVRPSPLLVDWDGDGVQDLLVGSENGEIFFYRNEGTEKKPSFLKGVKLESGGKVIKKGTRARIDVADWNSDGKLDLLLGDFVVAENPEKKGDYLMGGNVWVFLRK